MIIINQTLTNPMASGEAPPPSKIFPETIQLTLITKKLQEFRENPTPELQEEITALVTTHHTFFEVCDGTANLPGALPNHGYLDKTTLKTACANLSDTLDELLGETSFAIKTWIAMKSANYTDIFYPSLDEELFEANLSHVKDTLNLADVTHLRESARRIYNRNTTLSFWPCK
jgi:hypothetical protein